jgi:hypothetical protein
MTLRWTHNTAELRGPAPDSRALDASPIPALWHYAWHHVANAENASGRFGGDVRGNVATLAR